MKAPDVIYANDYGLWYQDKQPVKYTEAYIRKDALMEWAKAREQNAITNLVKLAYKTVIEKIESL